MNIADLRQEYMRERLDEENVAPDPYVQFDRWFKEAIEAKMPMLNAMTLATVSAAPWHHDSERDRGARR